MKKLQEVVKELKGITLETTEAEEIIECYLQELTRGEMRKVYTKCKKGTFGIIPPFTEKYYIYKAIMGQCELYEGTI